MANGHKDAATRPPAPEPRHEPRLSPAAAPSPARRSGSGASSTRSHKDAAQRWPSPPLSASPSPTRARFLPARSSPSVPPSPLHHRHLSGVREEDEDAATAAATADPRRAPTSRSPTPRFPGDMSHRPLHMLRADGRSPDGHRSSPTRRRRRRVSDTDSIDALDAAVPGGPYHHGGPYDAALASRNLVDKYSPLAAVRDSTLEAIRATPRENILDSLRHHVSLQGTASVPPGARDLAGNVMRYEEGADLMREADAPGGAYKRWAHVPYHPDDLKGKGEPSYTLERDLKARKHHKHRSVPAAGPESYEMLPARQRSASDAADAPPTAYASGGGLARRNSTGKRLSEGIKRRFGSFRRKKAPGEVR